MDSQSLSLIRALGSAVTTCDLAASWTLVQSHLLSLSLQRTL